MNSNWTIYNIRKLGELVERIVSDADSSSGGSILVLAYLLILETFKNFE